MHAKSITGRTVVLLALFAAVVAALVVAVVAARHPALLGMHYHGGPHVAAMHYFGRMHFHG